ncbi:C4-type Zn-finger protein [Trachipleistophora hominis]|uniref:C4-type Zn-finger protein n=1 Tax=Trachipleistophora hominis TaxID=72359 RepID=L7K053_TRAHO|nr:C4-type Zn-finger protein [Trachipleistophora hominis]
MAKYLTTKISDPMSPDTCNSPKQVEIQCTQCNNPAFLKTMRVDTPGQCAQILSTYTCPTCNIQDNAILPYEDKNSRGGIKITCKFTNKDDLKRYVCVFQNTILQFKKDDFIYEYSSSMDVTTVAEIVLRNAIDEIAQMWNIKKKTFGSVFDLRQELSNSSASLSHSGSVTSLESIQDVDNAKYAIEMLQDMVSNSGFVMELCDPSGFSRVAPVNKMLGECTLDDLNTFNDEKVKHEWINRE